jgi:hypothetical protein
MPENYDFDAATVHYNRVCEIDLYQLTSSQMQRLASAMQHPFPALVHLVLRHQGFPRPIPALPDGFLGGSAPSLQSLTLYSIPFPTFPKLLLSATHLVDLTLWKIPHSGYFSPEAIVTGLAALANLKSLIIELESPLSRPDQKRRLPPPPTRTVLPTLTRFEFQGVSEYLENLLTRVDAPVLDSICITFFHQLIFEIPQLAQFMRRTTRFQALNEAHVDFGDNGVQVGYLPLTQAFDKNSGLRISCRKSDWQFSSLAQVLTSFFPSVDMVEHLYINFTHWYDRQDIDNMQWLEIFHPFTAVKNLYLTAVSVLSIAPALEELVGDRSTEEFPILQNIFLEGLQPYEPIQKGIGKFVAARQLSDYPITVSLWERYPKPHRE